VPFGITTLNYTITIANSSLITTSTAYDVLVEDLLPPGVGEPITYGAISGIYITPTNTITWFIPGIEPGSTVVITYSATLTGTGGAYSTQTDFVTVTYTSLEGSVSGERAYTETASASTTLPLALLLKTETSGAPSPDGYATIGEEITYTLRYTVPAGTTIYDAVLTDTLPQYITYVVGSASPTPTAYTSELITWTLGDVIEGSYEVIFRAQVQNVTGVEEGDVLTNTSRLTWNRLTAILLQL